MRKRVRVVAVVVLLLLAGGLATWKLRGGGDPAPRPPRPAAADPWAAASLDEGAIVADMRAAHGDAPADLTPATASGRVVRRADGSGVAGAVVALAPDTLALAELDLPGAAAPPADATVVVTTDDAGAWTASALPPGRYAITATAPGLVPGTLPGVPIAPGAARTGLELALDAGSGNVHGTVSDVGGGPIAFARVRVRRDDVAAWKGARAGFVALTAADGSYALTLPEGAWAAEATAAEYTPARRDFHLAGAPVAVDFTLTPGATIRGQVVTRADGAPIAGAVVRATGGTTASRRRFDGHAVTATADAHGEFTLRGLGSGAIEVTATGRGYASTAPTTVPLTIGESAEGVRVVVDRAFSIAGFVVKKGAERTGIAGVQVGAFSLGTLEAVTASAPSGPDGYFEILGVHPASYFLFALGAEVMPEIGKPIAVTDHDVTDVLVVMAVGTTLAGKVVPPVAAQLSLELDADKIGITNMFDAVKAVMAVGEADATGAFVVKNAPTGTYTLVARTRDGRTGRLPIEITDADQTSLVVRLEDRAAISGRVVDAVGAPVVGVQVAARPTGGAGMKIRLQEGGGAVTGADGAFRVGGLEPGKVGVSVSDDHGALAWADAAHANARLVPIELELTGSSETTGVVLTVETRDGTIRGVVVGADRKPAADAWVTATLVPGTSDDDKVTITVGSQGGQAQTSDREAADEVAWGPVGPSDPVLTADDGRFSITGLRRGTYQLVAEGAGGATRARKSGIKTGDASVTLVLETLGSLSGVVTSGRAPVTDYTITCRGPAGTETQHVLAADGAYRFERRPAGTYTCTATCPLGPATGTAKVAGDAARLDLSIGAWGKLTGRIVNALTGAPLPGLKLVATGPSGAPGDLGALLTGGGPTTDPQGHFELDQLAPGRNFLVALDGGLTGIHIVAKTEFTLAVGQALDLGALKGLPPRSGPPGTLGLSTEVRGDKLAVTAVVAGGPAAAAGVAVGDTIRAIDGHDVADVTLELAADALDTEHVAAGQVVALALARGGQSIAASVTAAPAPP